ncbi:hypothetical protein ACIBF1_32440 [Spirillospora sp. NPDC050679]
MLIFKPGAERFDYFRLGDRVRRGQADPREILAAQDLYDNHFHHSPLWQRFLDGGADDGLLSLPSRDAPAPGSPADRGDRA